MARRLTTMTGTTESVRKALGLEPKPTTDEAVAKAAAEGGATDNGGVSASTERGAEVVEKKDDEGADGEKKDEKAGDEGQAGAEGKDGESGAAGEGEAAGAAGEKRGAKRGDYQARIDELNEEKRLIRAEADREKRENAELKSRLEAKEKAEAEKAAAKPDPDETPLAKPKREDFDDFQAFDDAKDEWSVNEGARRARVSMKKDAAAAAANSTEAREKTAREAEVAKHNRLLDEARTDHKDFDTVMDGLKDRRDIPDNQGLALAVYESDIRGHLMYTLAQDPERYKRIAQMSPVRAAVEVTKIEDDLKAARANPKKAKAPAPKVDPAGGDVNGQPRAASVSRAPRPVTHVTGNRGAGFDKKTTKDFKAYRAARSAERAAERESRY